MSLYRDVQGGGRLVADQQFRFRDDCPGNRDSLSLSTGELVGISIRHVGRNSNRVQTCCRPGPEFLSASHAMDLQWFGNQIHDTHPGIQGATGILKHHLEVTAHLPAALTAHRRGFLAKDSDVSRREWDQVHDGTSQARLAASRCPDDAKGTTALNPQADILDGHHVPLSSRSGKHDLRALNFKDVEVVRIGCRGVHVGIVVATLPRRGQDGGLHGICTEFQDVSSTWEVVHPTRC